MFDKIRKILTLMFFSVSWTVVFCSEQMKLEVKTVPLSRYINITYDIPANVPEEVIVKCEYRFAGEKNWNPAAVRKYRSKTAENILAADRKNHEIYNEVTTGEVKEYLAAGKLRTLVWQTFPQIPLESQKQIWVKVSILDKQKKFLASGEQVIELNNDGVLALSDFSEQISGLGDGMSPGWHYVKSFNGRMGGLEAIEGEALQEPVVFRPNLKGYYAIFVSVPETPISVIQLRLSSDFYSQRFDGFGGGEYFWRIAKMNNEHLIITQPAWTNAHKNNSFRPRLNYVRFVPLSENQYEDFTELARRKRDKKVFAYFEPYSWAFNEHVLTNEQFLQPMAAYNDAKVDFVDMQVGRLGAKLHYPSEIDTPLLGKTYGDPSPGGNSPESSGSARLALLTNPIIAANRAGKAFDIPVSANFGAGISYHPNEGDFAKGHPEWVKEKYFLQYKFKPVREHFLALYEENLKMGAKIISLDFGRYPRVADSPEQTTLFLKELRNLADKYSTSEQKIKILVRFPVENVKFENGNFIPEDWIKLRLVDYLVASGVFPNMQHFDGRKYIEMVRGTGIKCLLDIDGGNGHNLWPGGVLERIKQVYDWGADGIYIYQADARIVGSMTSGMKVEDKHYISLFGSSSAVRSLLEEFEKENLKYSTDIYVYYPLVWQSYRIKVWIEGANPEMVELYLNDKLMNRYEKAQHFYIVGEEGYKNNYSISGKPVTLKIKVKINGKWLEKIHEIQAIHHSAS